MPHRKLANFFGLPNLKLLYSSRGKNSRFIYLHYEHCDQQDCPHCGSSHVKTHQWKTRKVKDAPIRGKIPILYIRHRRMFCNSCKKTFTEQIGGISKYARLTERMQREIHYACENFSDLKKVRKHTACSSKTIYTRHYKHLELKQREREGNLWPKVLGIDEHSFIRNKQVGCREFVSILVDYDHHRPKELVPGRSIAQLKASLEHIKGRERVEYINMDLCTTFKSFAKEFFPNAKIVADHFHVVKLLHPRINQLRKAILGDNRKHPMRKLLLKNGHNLEVFQRKAIWRWLEEYPELKAVYEAKEWVHKLYRCKGYKRASKCLTNLTDWLAVQEYKRLQSFRKTLMKWREEILMFFKKRTTNAKTEGFNNVAKSIIKKAYGYRNFNHYRLKVLNVRSNAHECGA